MKLYHYTTIDTLALILKNKTLRFNRLDHVDDLEENVISNGVKLGKYTFVSCWTKSEDESIPLWKMYTDNGVGVRIALDMDMFHVYEYKGVVNFNGMPFMTNDIYNKTITPLEDFFNSNNLLLPVACHEIAYIFKDVEYVNDVIESYDKIVRIVQHPNNIEERGINIKKLGKYKQQRWAFEKESRFVLCILPGGKIQKPSLYPQFFNDLLFNSLFNGIEPTIDNYDMKLKDGVFDNMEVLLSPNISESKKVIVESLIHKYAPNATIKESRLKVKFK